MPEGEEFSGSGPLDDPTDSRGGRLQALLSKLPVPTGDIPPTMVAEDEDEAPHVDLLQLRMGGRDFLLPAGEVAEIVRVIPLTPVPMAPDHLLGVGNVHGQIICVVEPGRMMSLPEKPAPDSGSTRFVVLRHARMRVALRVDAVPAIYRVPEEQMHGLGDADAPQHGVRGWLQVDEVRYAMLDAKALLQE